MPTDRGSDPAWAPRTRRLSCGQFGTERDPAHLGASPFGYVNGNEMWTSSWAKAGYSRRLPFLSVGDDRPGVNIMASLRHEHR